MNYQIGQVLYICDEEKMKIIPIQVVEIISRTSLSNGKEKSFIVMFPDTKKTKTNISNITSKLFDNINLVEETMIANASTAIKKMRSAAELLSNDMFLDEKPSKEEEKIDQSSLHVQAQKNNDIIIKLGNGMQAKMNTNNLKEVVGKR